MICRKAEPSLKFTCFSMGEIRPCGETVSVKILVRFPDHIHRSHSARNSSISAPSTRAWLHFHLSFPVFLHHLHETHMEGMASPIAHDQTIVWMHGPVGPWMGRCARDLPECVAFSLRTAAKFEPTLNPA